MQTTRMLKIVKGEPFFLLVLVLLSAALGAAASLLHPLLALVPLLLLGLAIVFFRHWPLGASGLMLLATVLDRYNYELAGRTIKIEYVVVVALWGLLLARQFLKGESKFYLSLTALFTLGWLGSNFLSSCISPRPSATAINDLVRLNLMVAIFLILPNLIQTEKHLKQVFALFLIVGIMESVFGLSALALHYATGVNLGVAHIPSYPGPVPYGTLNASNIFGSYTMSVSLMFLVLLLSPPSRSLLPGGWILRGLLITLAAMIATLTRGAWLGFAVAAAFFFIIHRGFDRFWLKRVFLVGVIFAMALLSVAAVVYLLPKDIPLIDRLASFARLGSERTVVGRIAKYDLAISAWRERPLLGWGTGGMARVFGREQKVLAWVGNLEIHLLVDTGLVGLIAFALFVAALLFRAASALRKTQGSPFAPMLLSLIIGYIGILVAYQSTDATWLGLFWTHAGLLAAATRVIKMRVQSGERQHSA